MVEAVMDDTRQAALRVTLEELRRDRAEIEAAISVITRKLGLADAGPAMIPEGNGDHSEVAETRDVGPVHVTEGEFYGMSQPEAARAFLARAGRTRPQKTGDIMAALRKGGIHVGGKDPAGLLYRILLRDKRFRRVGTSLWGLDEWYPRRAPKDDTAEGEQEAADAGDSRSAAPHEEGEPTA